MALSINWNFMISCSRRIWDKRDGKLKVLIGLMITSWNSLLWALMIARLNFFSFYLSLTWHFYTFNNRPLTFRSTMKRWIENRKWVDDVSFWWQAERIYDNHLKVSTGRFSSSFVYSGYKKVSQGCFGLRHSSTYWHEKCFAEFCLLKQVSPMTMKFFYLYLSKHERHQAVSETNSNQSIDVW